MREAFTNSKFRRLFTGRLITNLGDSLYFVAATWFVHELSNDPFLTGLAGFVTLVPGAFQFVAGPLVDEWDVRRVLVVSQLLQAIVVSVIPLSAYFGFLSVELILVVMPVLATMNEFANPAMSAALPRLLDDDKLVAANSAFSVASDGTDFVGNGISGLAIAAFGAVSLFVFDAISFLVTTVLFATVAVPEADGDTVDKTEETPYRERLQTGFDYIRGSFLLSLLVGAGIANLTVGIALATMPSFAETMQVPQVPVVDLSGAGAYGVLIAAFTVGNVIGAVSASLVSDYPFGRVAVGTALFAAVAWAGAVLAGSLLITAPLFVVAFAPVGAFNIQIVALVQSAPPEEIVGRVVSVVGSLSVVAVPIGSLLGGGIGSVTSPTTAMLCAPVGLTLFGVYVVASPELRTLPRVGEVELQS